MNENDPSLPERPKNHARAIQTAALSYVTLMTYDLHNDFKITGFLARGAREIINIVTLS